MIVSRLAEDRLRGRNNGTVGSERARRFLTDQLKPISRGLNSSAHGDAAYEQVFPDGTNLVAVIPGTVHADQFVLVSAHYDHLGDEQGACRKQTPGDLVCNGAGDNASGVAAVLGIGRALTRSHSRPRRSVVLALWDSEEDGLFGSQYYVDHPLVPLSRTVASVNFDMQGVNLLPSLRGTTFAVAAETGGHRLQTALDAATADSPLETGVVSAIFGQYRSDYASFYGADVPGVFFTDSTGPCYHTAKDEAGVVDFGKLATQVDTATHLTRRLASDSKAPKFDTEAPIATYDDLMTISKLLDRAWPDIRRFSADDQATARSIRRELHRLVADGRAAFDSNDQATLLGDAAKLVEILTHGKCNGFVPRHSSPWWIKPLG